MRILPRKERTYGSADEPSGNWRKSSHSMANGNCVEVAELPGDRIGLRDSKNPRGLVLRFTRAEWSAFVSAVRTRQFDRE